jgi:pseudaminic acid biosynthesis-associated methylase
MSPVSNQLDDWRGEFGVAYTDRNPLDWRTRLPAFTDMCRGLDIASVLEVGCNRGHNLRTFIELLGPGARVEGVEPNPYARGLASQVHPQAEVTDGDIYALPFPDRTFDLVFTAGVLIHVPPDRLARALSELDRVSRRYVLCVEYYAPEETEVVYQDRVGMLWKRDFEAEFAKHLPELALVRSGYVGEEAGFDHSHWWMFERVTS